MTEQLNLTAYRGEPPHVAGSATSKQAADAIKPMRLSLFQRVHNFIEEREKWGATQEEIHLETGIKENTLRPRIRELEIKGLIEKTDETRKTKSGRNAVVYRAVAA